MDSGCSKNLTSDFTKLLIFTWNDDRYVTFRDNAKGEILGIYENVKWLKKSNEDDQTQPQHKDGEDLIGSL